jgi:hypothetical protein
MKPMREQGTPLTNWPFAVFPLIKRQIAVRGTTTGCCGSFLLDSKGEFLNSPSLENQVLISQSPFPWWHWSF